MRPHMGLQNAIWPSTPLSPAIPISLIGAHNLSRNFMLIGIIILAGFWAGLQNSLAGGGSFVTLPVLILSGMSPLAANITSTVALFPGQVTSGLTGRRLVTGAGKLPSASLEEQRVAFYCSTRRHPYSHLLSRGWFSLPPRSSPGAAFSASPGAFMPTWAHLARGFPNS